MNRQKYTALNKYCTCRDERKTRGGRARGVSCGPRARSVRGADGERGSMSELRPQRRQSELRGEGKTTHMRMPETYKCVRCLLRGPRDDRPSFSVCVWLDPSSVKTRQMGHIDLPRRPALIKGAIYAAGIDALLLGARSGRIGVAADASRTFATDVGVVQSTSASAGPCAIARPPRISLPDASPRDSHGL